MRKEFGQELRSQFTAAMKQQLPDYLPTKVVSNYFWPGDRPFVREIRDRLWCWVVLSPGKRDLYEEFHVLIGWSELARFPECNAVPAPPLDGAEFTVPEYLFHVGELATPRKAQWVIQKTKAARSTADFQAMLDPIPKQLAKELVAAQIPAAMECLLSLGIPYLQKLATAKASRT